MQQLVSPLDAAMVNGEILRIKPSYGERPEHAGLLCRAIGGTRGRPTVAILGAPDGSSAFEIDKRHLTRARLATGADATLEGQLAWQARFGASADAL